MATPTWNQIAAPNFSAGNDLIAQAMNQLTKATTGFRSIADQYKDTIQKRNLGLIQEYVNSAKTPEELQSEGFQAGLAKLTGNMGGDYDTLAKAQLVDKAYDSLLSRKANQVSISSNEFRLAQDQLEANKKQAISNIFAINDPAMRQAAIDQAVKDKVFDSSLYLQTLAAELTGKTNQQTYDYNKATEDMRKEALRLGNEATRNKMKNDDMVAATNYLEAQARLLSAGKDNKLTEGEYKRTPEGILTTLGDTITSLRQDNANTLKSYKYKSVGQAQEDMKRYRGLTGGSSDAAYDSLMANPKFRSLSQPEQAQVYVDTVVGFNVADNITDTNTWYISDNNKKEIKALGDRLTQSAYDQRYSNTYLREQAEVQKAIIALGFAGVPEDQANNMVNAYLGKLPKNDYTSEDNTPTTQDKAKAQLLDQQSNSPMSILLSGLNANGGIGLNLKPTDKVGTPREKFQLTAEEKNRLSSLSDYASLLEKVSISSPSPTNTDAFQKSVRKLHFAQAELGQLDALNADRYIAEIKGYLADKSLDTLKRKALEEKLKMFESNLKNTKGIKAD